MDQSPDWRMLMTAPIQWEDLTAGGVREGRIARLGHLTGSVTWCGTTLVFGSSAAEWRTWNIDAISIDGARADRMQRWAMIQVETMLRDIVADILMEG